MPSGDNGSAHTLSDGVLISHWGRVMGLRVDAGLRTVRGNLGTYGRLIARFVESHGSDAQKLRHAVNENTWETVKHIAHVLKSTAGSIGALQLAATAAEIQSMDESNTPQQKQRLVLQLAHEVELLHKELERAVQQLPQATEVTTGQTPVISQDLPALHAELAAYLSSRDMAAVRFVREHEACLRQSLGNQGSALVDAVRRFDYDAALSVLQPSTPHD